MYGASLSIQQPSGVTTTWATVTDIMWQPGKSAVVEVGFFLDEPSFLAGNAPVCKQEVQLDVTQINPALPIPPQIFAQLTAAGAVLAGATITTT